MRGTIRTAAVVALLAVSAGAEAQTHPPGVVANEATNAAWLELGFTSISDYDVGLVETDVTLLMFTFGGMFRVAEMIELGLSVPVTYASTFTDLGLLGERESSGLALGNPLLRGAFVLEHPRARIRLGLGLSLPLADDDTTDGDLDEDDDYRIGASFGPAVAHARLDSWLWLANRWGLVFATRADGDAGDVVWAGELAVGSVFDADDDDPDGPADDPDETETYFQLAGEVGGRIGDTMVVGGRMSLWWHTSTEDENDADDDYDNAQLALAPFFRIYGEDWFGSASFLVALDEPDGVFGDGEGIWALYFTGGIRAE